MNDTPPILTETPPRNGEAGKDFMLAEGKWDWIVTNPPWRTSCGNQCGTHPEEFALNQRAMAEIQRLASSASVNSNWTTWPARRAHDGTEKFMRKNKATNRKRGADIRIMQGPGRIMDSAEIRAHAKLIAAAPELLAALESLLSCCIPTGQDTRTDRAMQQAQKAITKATLTRAVVRQG